MSAAEYDRAAGKHAVGQPDRTPGTRKLLVDVRTTAPIWDVTEAALERVRQEAPADWNVVIAATPVRSDGDGGLPPAAEVLREIVDTEVYFGFGISLEHFRVARALHWVHSASAGVASALFDEMRDSGIPLTNSAGVHGTPIAEHVLAGILHFTRAIDIAVANQARGVWDKSPMMAADSPMREIGGSRVLIVGAGGLGTAIATRLTFLGARCVGLRRRPELGTPEGFERVASPDALEAELSVADVVVLCAPATPETEQLLNRARIALLRPEAIVVNVARGSLVDEGALAEALGERRIRGAFLDVASREPLGADSPLWGKPGLLITPHVSGVAPATFWEREMDLFLDNWRRYREGMPLRNLVDKQAGY